MISLLHALRTLCVAAAVSFAFIPAAQAAPPMVKTQVPGWYRLMVGDFEVTVLYDGTIGLDPTLLKNAPPQDIRRLLRRAFADGPKMQTAVNAFLINTGDHLVLVDAGAAKLFGPTLGAVAYNLKAAGYDPAQVDTVLVTHLHGDHIGGLLGADGKPVFPNADVRVSRADADFWLSPAVAEKAAPDAQAFFKIARDVAAPFQASGRWKTFAPGEELVPGIKAADARGHTPGHIAYSVQSKGSSLLILGDAVHSAAVQFPRPTVAIEFDVDKKQAVATRLRLFKEAAAGRLLVAGMHLPFPGIGHVRAEGKNRYAWVPAEFSPLQ